MGKYRAAVGLKDVTRLADTVGSNHAVVLLHFLG